MHSQRMATSRRGASGQCCAPSRSMLAPRVWELIVLVFISSPSSRVVETKWTEPSSRFTEIARHTRMVRSRQAARARL